jgi:hypothetical protein
MSTTPSATHSEGENMPEIQSLTIRVQSLSHSVDWWNTAMIWGLALAAIAAVFVVIATRIVVSKTGELSTAQDLLSEAKDRDRDVKIAEAQKAAGEAHERASKADERAFKTEKEAARLTKEAEDERMARVKIEERVAWRHLTKEQQSGIAGRLKRFANQWGNIGRVSYDAEITAFATDIAQTLSAAGWHVLPPSAISMRETSAPAFGNPIEPVITGVTISSTPDARAREMADALSGELHSLGYDASVSPKREPAQEVFSIIWVLIENRPEGPQGELKLRAQNGHKKP